MKLNLVSGSYRNRYAAVNTKRVINWYVHKDLIQDEDSKYKAAFMQFPGLSAYVVLPLPTLLTTTSASAALNASSIQLTSVTGITNGNTITILCTNGSIFQTTISNIVSTTVSLATNLISAVSNGAQVIVSTISIAPRKIFVARTVVTSNGISTPTSRCFAVVGNYLYEIINQGNYICRGQMISMTTDSSTVYMEVNYGNQVMIAHSSASYVFNLATNTLTYANKYNYISNALITGGGSAYTSPTATVYDSIGINGVVAITLSGEVVNTVSITNGGTGYHSPAVAILDPTGTGASITLTQTNGVITGYTLVSGGSGYTNPVVVVYDSSATGSGAILALTETSGSITAFTITNNGSGYTNPVVGIQVPAGSGATITLTVTYTAVLTGLTYLHYTTGYGFACTPQGIFFSNLNDFTTWQAQEFFTPVAHAAAPLAAVVWRDTIHCFTAESVQIYIDDGVTPFSVQPQSTLEVGVAAVDTICVFDQGILFLGKNRKGQVMPYLYNGYVVTPIAPMSDTWQLNNPSLQYAELTWDNLTQYTWDNWYQAWGTTNITSAYADIQYGKNGNIFWHLTIPNLQTTWVFDVTTKEWIERQSLNPNSMNQDVFRGKWMCNWDGNNLVSDIYTGTIFFEDYTVVTENNTTVTRTITSQIISNLKQNITVNEFELETSTGLGLKNTPLTPATIQLSVSRDGGNTFGNTINLSTGASGNYLIRPKVYNLGTARDWVFNIVLTDQADLTIQEALVHGITELY